jgi:hypothetical protein
MTVVEPTSPDNAECTTCIYAAEHGWWGAIAPARTHCRRCHRFWASLREAHCVRCCRQFASNAAADAHTLTEGCLDPATALRRDGRPKFVARERRFGPVWSVAYYGQRPTHWEALDDEAGEGDDELLDDGLDDV